MKVVVIDDMNDPMGVGTIIRDEELTLTDENDKVICKVHSPVIVMEDGEIFTGFECWWITYEEFVTVNQQMLYETVVRT
jgi:hypothetical protein